MQRFGNSWRVKTLLVMVLRLNQSLKYREHIPTPDCSGPPPTFAPFYSEYSTTRMSSTIPGKTPSCCPEYECRKKLTADSWRLEHITLHLPEHLQVAHQKNQNVRSVHRRIEPAPSREFNTNKDQVGCFGAFP